MQSASTNAWHKGDASECKLSFPLGLFSKLPSNSNFYHLLSCMRSVLAYTARFLGSLSEKMQIAVSFPFQSITHSTMHGTSVYPDPCHVFPCPPSTSSTHSVQSVINTEALLCARSCPSCWRQWHELDSTPALQLK